MLGVDSIAVIGLGVIGGSICMSLRKKGFKGRITGVDKVSENFRLAKLDGFVDNDDNTYKSALENADVVFVATPLGAYEQVFCEIGPLLKSGCILTDVGSVKACVHEIFNRCLGDQVEFVGGHPMAGSEKNGFANAQSHMFENAYYFLTVSGEVKDDAVEIIKWLVDLMGAKAKVMDAKAHDHLVSKTSHMPHITATLLVDLLKNSEINMIDFVGGGFRDTTRIASGLPGLWKDILLYNKEAILSTMEEHINRLSDLKDMLEAGDEGSIYNLLHSSKELRENIPKHLSGAIEKELAIYLDVEDRPGIIAESAHTLANAGINIKDIEIIHARENIPGVLKIGFYEEEDYLRAVELFPEC